MAQVDFQSNVDPDYTNREKNCVKENFFVLTNRQMHIKIQISSNVKDNVFAYP